MRSAGKYLELKLLLIWSLVINCIWCQYEAGNGAGYRMSSNNYGPGYGAQQGGGYGGYGGDGSDERPKVHLGLRVKIPAFKFELPRFSLPKITVSAKIRQPDKPRTITLPEINLDTTSKDAHPGEDNGNNYGGNNYGGDNYRAKNSNYGHQPQQPSYQAMSSSYGGNNGGYAGGYGGQEKTSMISFSTEEDTSHYRNPKYGAESNGYNKQRPQYMQKPAPSYSSTNSHPMYQAASQVKSAHFKTGYQLSGGSSGLKEDVNYGFDEPVYRHYQINQRSLANFQPELKQM